MFFFLKLMNNYNNNVVIVKKGLNKFFFRLKFYLYSEAKWWKYKISANFQLLTAY